MGNLWLPHSIRPLTSAPDSFIKHCRDGTEDEAEVIRVYEIPVVRPGLSECCVWIDEVKEASPHPASSYVIAAG